MVIAKRVAVGSIAASRLAAGAASACGLAGLCGPVAAVANPAAAAAGDPASAAPTLRATTASQPPSTRTESIVPIALIPQPASLVRQEGWFRLVDGAVIGVPAGDTAAAHAAQRLVALAQQSRGLRLAVRVLAAGTAQQTAPSAAIVVRRDSAVTGAEAYTLVVAPSGIDIAANGDAGLDYAVTTLWQLLTSVAGQGAVELPAVRIADHPRYAWRGLMLDVARHFMPAADVKRLLEQMALHKLNVFHWHLTDDQGWRLAIERYPALTSVGAWRRPPGGTPSRYGGYYTQAEVRDIVAYAAERHITVVPEIDMPGHAQAAVAAYPQFGLGAPGTPHRPPVGVDWGVNPYLYNVDEATFAFIERVLDEVMALFPSSYIHVGGDEAVKDAWAASPVAQARIRALGLGATKVERPSDGASSAAAGAAGAAGSSSPAVEAAGSSSAAAAEKPTAATPPPSPEDRLQSWFIGRIGEYLAAHGRRLIGWDEILEGGLPAGASVMSWRGTEGAVAAARQGHDVVMAPAGWLYLNYLQSWRGDEPAAHIGNLPIERLYAFDPQPQGLDAAQQQHVLGLEAALWTEYMPSPWHAEHAIFPRLSAVAELAWSPAASHDWAAFVPRLAVQLRRYGQQGIAAADSAFAVDAAIQGDLSTAIAAGEGRVRLSTQVAHGSIRYTTDGRAPGAASDLYAAPIAVQFPATVRAAAFGADGVALSAPRTTVFDAPHLRRVDSSRLTACPGREFGLRVPLTPDATTLAPVHDIDIFDACWIWPKAPLDGVDGIVIEAARLARNYGLAHDAAKVMRHPSATQAGEFEVHLDRCDGPLLARLSLPDGDRLEPLRLQTGMAPTHGSQGPHDLCLISTAPVVGRFVGIDAVQLEAGQ